MSDEQQKPSVIDTTPPTHDADGRPLTTSVVVAEGANTDVHAHQAKDAHAQPAEAFITHGDGSKSVAFADTPRRREED